MIIGNFMATNTDLQQVWFIVSPHNPLKDKKTLAPDRIRLQMVRLAIEDNPHLRASDIEFNLPQPSYTIDTLIYLKEKYPQHELTLIMGSDNLISLEKWKNYQQILSNYTIYVYRRPGHDVNPYADNKNLKMLDVPQIMLSASQIRIYIEEGKSIRYMVHESVYEFLDGNKLYKK